MMSDNNISVAAAVIVCVIVVAAATLVYTGDLSSEQFMQIIYVILGSILGVALAAAYYRVKLAKMGRL